MTFWDTDEHERGSRANIPRLIEGMAHVLATHDVQQEIFESVHECTRDRLADAIGREIAGTAVLDPAPPTPIAWSWI